MEDNSSGFWDKEEFEDCVAKGIILQHEQEHQTANKKNDPAFAIDFRAAQSLLRRVGCYFPPNDRLYYSGIGIQPEVDGVPDYATFSAVTARKDGYEGEYGIATIARRIFPKKGSTFTRLPAGWYCDRLFKYVFELISFYPGAHGTAVGRMVAALSADGVPVPTYINRVRWNGFREVRVKDYGHESEIIPGLTDWSGRCAITLFYWCDRVNMFNVVAEEADAKVTFGVYEEQIKSLFYARNLPMTASGRKRPILHWVKAHQRRIKEGTDVNIEKYLRGSSDFVMDGTKFSIALPIKKAEL